METNIKHQLINAVNNIKNKIKTIESEENANNIKLQKIFKPLIDPLDVLIKKNDKNIPVFDVQKNIANSDTIDSLNSSVEYNDFKDFINADSNEKSDYYEDTEDNVVPEKKTNDTLVSLKKEDIIDIYDTINVPFGIRSENKNLMMGNSIVNISAVNNSSLTEKVYMVRINDKNYELTSGLKELLIRNKPNLNLVTEKDKIAYKEMLISTNAHKRDYNPSGQMKGDKGSKYRDIIKPFFLEIDDGNKQKTEQLMKLKTGGSIPLFKKYKTNTDYVYWDDPNELIERLKLLIGSKSAGNTNHDNEIISIVEELKEAGIIKE